MRGPWKDFKASTSGTASRPLGGVGVLRLREAPTW
jgi:hypothetical protein